MPRDMTDIPDDILRHGESVVIRDVLRWIIDLRDIRTFWGNFVDLMTGYGFPGLIYVYLRNNHLSAVNPRDDVILMVNHDAAFIRDFIDSGKFLDSPGLRMSQSIPGDISWQIYCDRSDELTDRERAAFDIKRAHGVGYGWSVIFPSFAAGAYGALSLAGRAGLTQADCDAIWARYGGDINLLANAAHLKLLTMPYSEHRRPLTRRQKEVLEWIGEGKTARDIAVILNISVATVEKHLRLAREALGAETTAQALVKASQQNRIFMM